MEVTEKIIEKLKLLPKDKQVEVLDYVEFLQKKFEDKEREQWEKFSLSSALHGLESEDSIYSVEDLRVRYS